MLKRVLAMLLTASLCVSMLAGCGEKAPVSTGGDAPKTTPKVETKAETTLVVTAAGSVTPEKGVKEVVIEADGVILENATLDKITVSAKLGEGTATLNKVKAKTLDIQGGGQNSVHVKDSTINEIQVNRKDGIVRVVMDKTTTADSLVSQSNVVLDISGLLEQIVMQEGSKGSTITIQNSAKVEGVALKDTASLTVNAPIKNLVLTGKAEGSKVEIAKTATVTTLATDVKVDVKGDGKIETVMTDDKANVTSTIKADKTVVTENPVSGNSPSAPSTQPTATPKAGGTVPKATPTPAPVPPVEEEPAPAPSTTVVGVEAVSSPSKMIYLKGETMDYSGASVNLVYSDGRKETVSSTGFAAKGIEITSTAQGAIFAPATKSEALSVRHTVSGHYIGLATVYANVEPLENVLAASPVSYIDKGSVDGSEPPYQLLKINYQRVKALDSISVKITDQNGRLIHQDDDLPKTQNLNASTQNSFRYLGNVTGKEGPDLEALERTNETKLPVGTVMNIVFDAVYDGHPYHYLLKMTYTVTQSDFDMSTYVSDTEVAAALAGINAASSAAEMKAALKANHKALSIDIAKYNALKVANQDTVATAVYNAGTDYATLVAVKTAFDTELKKVATTLTVTAAPASQIIKAGAKVGMLTATPTIANGTVATHQWYSVASSTTTGGTAISGATTATYTPATAPAPGATAYYYCVVTSTDNGAISATSNVCSVTTAATLTGTVAITGDAKFDKTLTADITGLTNVSGTVSYQWQRKVGTAAAADITGATNATYKAVVAADVGATLSCVVSTAGTSGTVTGTAKTPIAKADGPAAPTVVTSASDANNEILLVAGEGQIDVTIGSSYAGKCEVSIGDGAYSDLTKTITAPAGAQTINIRLKATATHEASAATTTKITVKAVTYAVVVNLNKDGALYTSSGKAIKAQLSTDPKQETTLIQDSTTGVFNGKLANGAYKIFADTVDTGVVLTVNNEAPAATVVNYYTLAISAAVGLPNDYNVVLADPAVTATYNGKDVNLDAVVLGGGKLEVTAIDPSGLGTATSVTYSWAGVDDAPVLTQKATVAKVTAEVTAACTVTGVDTPLSAFTLANAADESVVYGSALKTDRAVTDDITKGTGAITYASNDTNVATVDAKTGGVTIVGVGDATISVTKAASAGFLATTKSYKITVTAMPLTYKSGLTVADKVYDGTVNAAADAITGTIVIKEALPYGDALTYTYTGVYTDKNVSDTSAMTITPTIVGPKAANYTFADITTLTGKVTKAKLQVSGLTVTDRAYDGTKVAIIDLSKATIEGKIATDTIGAATYPAAGTFATADVGEGIVVAQTGKTNLATGADNGNYEIVEQAGLTGKITKATPIITASNAAVTFEGKAIDVSKHFSVTPAGVALTYTVTNDTGTGTFASPNLTVTKAGTFNVTATAAATNNYGTATKTITLTVELGAAPAAPTLGKTDAAHNAKDGTITGLLATTLYEYKLSSDSTYTAVTAGSATITGLAEGEYKVRIKANDLYNAGTEATVIIAKLADPATILASVTVDKSTATVAKGATSLAITAEGKNADGGKCTGTDITYAWTFVVEGSAENGTAPTITAASAAATTFNAASATEGTYNYTVTATQGSITKTAKVVITVTAAP